MADSNLVRQRRFRAHKAGDHSLCSGCVKGPGTSGPLRSVQELDRRPAAKVSTLPAVMEALEVAGRAESYLGMTAMAIAERLDGSEGIVGLASTVKELRDTMDKALAGAEKAGRMLEMRRGRKRDAKTVDGSAS